MIARRPLQRHDRLSWRVRRHERLALVVLTLLVVPAPGVVAQAAPRQEPTELWRQFPLDPERSTPQSPAERELALPSSTRIGGSTGEDRQGSLVTTQGAAIVFAIAMVLMLATARAYATRGMFELRSDGRRRRLIRPFTNVVHQPRAAWNSGRQFAVALKVNPDPLSGSAGNQSTMNEAGTLERRLEMYSTRERSDRTVLDESESLKAKANMHGSLAKSDDRAAQAEVETLKEKLAVQHAQSDSPPGDDLQALKEKLDVEPVRTKSESIRHSELEILKAKLGAHEQSLKGERRTEPIGDAPSRDPDRGTPPNVLGKMSRSAARRSTTSSSDAHAVSVDAHTLTEPPTVKATKPHLPAASSAQALPDGSMQGSRATGMGAKVLWLALLLLVIGLLLLNIAVLLDIGVAS